VIFSGLNDSTIPPTITSTSQAFNLLQMKGGTGRACCNMDSNRAVVETPSLEVFENHGDVEPRDMVWRHGGMGWHW